MGKKESRLKKNEYTIQGRSYVTPEQTNQNMYRLDRRKHAVKLCAMASEKLWGILSQIAMKTPEAQTSGYTVGVGPGVQPEMVATTVFLISVCLKLML